MTVSAFACFRRPKKCFARSDQDRVVHHERLSHHVGQEAVEAYYRDNVNRQRRYVKQWAGEIDVYGADMHYVRDIYVYVDELEAWAVAAISQDRTAQGRISRHANF